MRVRIPHVASEEHSKKEGNIYVVSKCNR